MINYAELPGLDNRKPTRIQPVWAYNPLSERNIAERFRSGRRAVLVYAEPDRRISGEQRAFEYALRCILPVKRIGTVAGTIGCDRTGARYTLPGSFHCLMLLVRWLVQSIATVSPLVKVSIYSNVVKISAFASVPSKTSGMAAGMVACDRTASR